MKKNNQSRRMVAMALAACVATSAMPVTAFADTVTNADGSTTETSTTTNADGSTTTNSTTTSADGNTTSSTTTTESAEGSAPKVTLTVVSTTVKDAEGNVEKQSNTTQNVSTTTEQNNESGGTTTTVETNTNSTTTENAPTQFVPPAEGDGTTGEAPTGNTQTGYVEGSAASEFVEGTTTDQTTTTTRTESSTDTTVTDYKDRVVEVNGTSSGSETTTTTETVVDKYIEDRDKLENDRCELGREEQIGKDTTPTDEFPETEVPTTETEEQIKMNLDQYVGDITITLTPDGEEHTGSAAVDEEKLYQNLLAANRPQSSETETKNDPITEDVTDDDGNKIGTVTTETTTNVKTDVNDVLKNGKVVGYGTTTTTTETVVKTTVLNEVKELSPEVTTGKTTTTVDNSETEAVVKLPERPSESETKDASGATTKVTVENIVDENDKVVGYLKKTVVTNAAGKEIATGSETIWGTYSKTVTTKETLETTTTKTEYITTTTVDTEITQGRVVGGEWITSTARSVTASMDEVTEDRNHGITQLSALNIDRNLIAGLQDKPDKSNTDLFNPKDWVEEKTIDGQTFQYLGHLAGSDYLIYRTDGSGASNTDVYIYVLKDKDGNEFYGYCCDVATHAKKGTLYEISDLENQTYYQGTDAESHIRGIAMNGFWATSSGTGSLANVQKVLEDYLKNQLGYSDEEAVQEAATLTEGQALAATQAAMWQYGNNGQSYAPYDANVSKYELIDKDYNVKWTDGTDGDRNVQNLYKALLTKTLPREASTNILDASDITGSSITIGDKATDDDGNLLAQNTDDNPNNDVFNTSVSFTVALVPTANDNLEVIVYQGGIEVGRKSVTADSASSKTADSATYTLEGLQLQEGLEVNLSLEGTQNLKKGVYLYTAQLGVDASQTFVGVAEGNRTVALDVNMRFDVTDETATKHSKSGSDDSRTKSGSKTTRRVDTVVDEEVVAMMEVTSVTITNAGYEWENSYGETWTYPSGGNPPTPPTPPNDPPTEEPPTDIPDEKPPLSNVPGEDEGMVLGAEDEEDPMVLGAEEEAPLIAATGDSNHMATGFGGMLAALAGMFMLRRKKEN